MKIPGPAHRRFGKRRLRMFYRQSQSVIAVTSPKKHQAVQSIASKTNNLCFGPPESGKKTHQEPLQRDG